MYIAVTEEKRGIYMQMCMSTLTNNYSRYCRSIAECKKYMSKMADTDGWGGGGWFTGLAFELIQSLTNCL